ncbi:SDR family NAD(P)-dependent oxidoreductase [Leucobacter tenebrionis]|uniref:SDR family NAD(P)-dependent oxidoreductase n=1 Tax=Leucobacter tenebrionis TaxID=2873270 RepID=UPI001CA78AA5|nr:SDR family NAD(P)-dependent oxidoreductase [Leucobacter tenebrionis]QZY51065.1 SDR family oxidoreductase [Leucobacter tenebrionis]
MNLNRTLPRRVIVTGASSGIGRAVAEGVLASEGAVLGIDLRTAPDWQHERLAQREADVSDPARIAEIFAEADGLLGGAPDAVVHCAGIYRWGPLDEMTADEWDMSMRINARGSFVVAQAAARAIAEGAIVLLSSVAYARGDETEPGAAYAASKGAIVSLTRQLAAELGPKGIRVNAVAPGMILTPMLTLGNTPGAVETLTAKLPSRRLGTVDDVAAACLFLTSGAAGYITGETLHVDGGYTAT